MTKVAIDLVAAPTLVDAIAVSPDGRRIAHPAESRLWVRALDQTESVAIPGSEDGAGPFFSPDGTRVAFSRQLSSRRSTCGVEKQYDIDFPDALPGGEWILFSKQRSPPKGTNRRLDLPPQTYANPRLSPDGSRFAVETVDDAGRTRMWVYSLTTNTQGRELTANAQGPVWIDDRRIADRLSY